ncbi:MAG: hypothetical protein JWO87_137 [Phycisphaerales bacterium]|jgi:heme/copper-type cytochrome/quinol oxidase subunit 2|nr:hypothetical protein [Phycisphaerales bacterium]MDB5298474.1 hypothetical protein [Phycisphaerales bacterium]MDB5305595.1 hypothetical protein [Phycisphaerales bacterium]
MGKIWLRIWITIKITLFALLALYILLFVIFNHDNHADVWTYPSHSIKTSVLTATLFAFLAGVIGTILVRTTFKTLRQIRDVQDRSRHEKLQREVEDMKAKASMLRPKPPAPESDE